MTRLFDESGRQVPVTVLRAGPCVVLQVRDEKRDGYRAVQIGYLEEGLSPHRISKPERGHLAKAGSPAVRVIRELRLADGANDPELGDRLTVELFEGIDKVDIVATSKGKGFQGVMRRYGFRGGKATHGSMFHRSPGSIGQAAWPAKVFKGKKMPGQMGNKRVTERRVSVVKVDADNHLLLVKGSVPGARNGYVLIKQAG